MENITNTAVETAAKPETTPDAKPTAAEESAPKSAEIITLERKLAEAKAANDKLSAENADWKRKNRALMTEDEQRKADEQERNEAIQKERDALKKQLATMQTSTKLMERGADKATADELAELLYGVSDADAVIGCFSKMLEARAKEKETEILKRIPAPASGSYIGNVDFAKKIEEANARGDVASVAYYTRLAQQETQKF